MLRRHLPEYNIWKASKYRKISSISYINRGLQIKARHHCCCCCCCEVASVMSDSVQFQRWQPTRVPHPWDSPSKITGVDIIRNAGLEEAQAGIKISRRNTNNLRYAGDTAHMSESEELKSLLMKVRE